MPYGGSRLPPPPISHVVWSGQGSKVRPLLFSGHQVHCHLGTGPTSPQVLSPSLLACGMARPLWVAVEGPRDRVRPAAPTMAVTRPISVFVFAQLSLSSRGFLFLLFLFPHPFLSCSSIIPPLALSACSLSDSSSPPCLSQTLFLSPISSPLPHLCPTEPSLPLVSLFPVSCALAVPACHSSFVSLCLSHLPFMFSPTTLYLSAPRPRQSLLIPGKSASRFGRRGSALGIGAVEEVVIHPGAAALELPARAVLRSLSGRRPYWGRCPLPGTGPKGVQGRVPRL